MFYLYGGEKQHETPNMFILIHVLVVNNIYFALIGFGCNTCLLDVVTFLSLFLNQLFSVSFFFPLSL